MTEGGADSRSKVSKQQPTGKSRLLLANSVSGMYPHTNSHVPSGCLGPTTGERLQHGPKGIKYLLSGPLWEKACQPCF